jgi:hypothetical protein
LLFGRLLCRQALKPCFGVIRRNQHFLAELAGLQSPGCDFFFDLSFADGVHRAKLGKAIRSLFDDHDEVSNIRSRTIATYGDGAML